MECCYILIGFFFSYLTSENFFMHFVCSLSITVIAYTSSISIMSIKTLYIILV